MQLVGYSIWQRANLHRAKSAIVSERDVTEGNALAEARFPMLFTSRGRHGSPVPFYCQRSAPRHCRMLTSPMSAQIALCTILSTIAMYGRRRDRH